MHKIATGPGTGGAVSPPGAVPSLAEAAGGEATLSNAQASLPVSFFTEAHFGSLAELLRPCPGQSLPWIQVARHALDPFRAMCSVDAAAAVLPGLRAQSESKLPCIQVVTRVRLA